MRYYFDFCHKYHFQQGTNNSLSAFLKKLDEKKQSVQFQKQAEQAVWLYFAWILSSKKQQDYKDKDYIQKPTDIPPNTYIDNRQEYKSSEIVSFQSDGFATKKKLDQKRGADWTRVFEDLKNTILVRHYSHATLKTYTGWVRKFQAFTESKDPRLLSTEDVNQFLTMLVVKKQVAASTQNQAFNAL
jgi:hypothetical protein